MVFLVLIFIGVALLVNAFAERKTVCINSPSTVPMTPVDVKLMMTDCFDRCETGDHTCMLICEKMLEDINNLMVEENV